METSDQLKLRQIQWEQELKLEQAIREAKEGYKYRSMDHVADWYSEKCTAIRIEERIRDYNESRNN